MDNESSNEVLSIDSYESNPPVNLLDDGEKPLIKLFRRLINNDTKQNTVLTNAQIMNILQKEFDLDISCSSEMEIEIYLNLMKTFLKNWPLWDKFDLEIQVLKKKNDIEGIKELLQINYENIKEFLRIMLSVAKPLLKKAVKDVKLISDETEKSLTTVPDIDSVVLEIYCTRSKLNNFFFKTPNPDLGNTIFNTDSKPRNITLETFTLKSILNWPNIKIYINGYITIRRDCIHTLKHILVNKKNYCDLAKPVELKTNLQLKEIKKYKDFSKQSILESLQQTLQDCHDRELLVLFYEICNIIKKDLQNFPRNIKMPITYRKTLNKYPYVRYLYSEVNSSKPYCGNQFDLQLEETMSPHVFLRLSNNNSVPRTGTLSSDWLKIECVSCKSIFTGQNMSFELKQHFAEYHQDEPDWQCTNCKMMFSMIKLAEDHWHHVCGTY